MPSLAAVARAYPRRSLDRSSHTSEIHTTSQRQAFIRDDYIYVSEIAAMMSLGRLLEGVHHDQRTSRYAGRRRFLNGRLLTSLTR